MYLKRQHLVSLIYPDEGTPSNQGGYQLSDFENVPGYVLLGEPGMGKSSEFHREAKRVGGNAPVSAHDLIHRGQEFYPKWKNGVVFIEDIDQVRTNDRSLGSVLKQIASCLQELGNPPFRISCRTASWLSAEDLTDLHLWIQTEKIQILLLNPPTMDEVCEFISTKGLNPTALIPQAEEQNIRSFLFNPFLLITLLDQVEHKSWPSNQREAFKMACTQMMKKHRQSEDYPVESSCSVSEIDAVFRCAGLLSSLMLITNHKGWSFESSNHSQILSINDISTDNPKILSKALSSNLFWGSPDCRVPSHRMYAEFLAAYYLNEQICHEKIAHQILLLLTGKHQSPFLDLQGITGWLVTLNPYMREILLEKDPIATAFYGQINHLTIGERESLLKNIAWSIDLNRRSPSRKILRSMAHHHLSSLVSVIHLSSDRSEKRQLLAYDLMSGVQQFPHQKSHVSLDTQDNLSDRYQENWLTIVYDATWNDNIRCLALKEGHRVLKDASNFEFLFRGILKDLKEKRLLDTKNHLLGTLLHLLYPNNVSPSELLDFLIDGPVGFHHNSYMEFWCSLMDQSDDHHVRELLDSLCDCSDEVIQRLVNHRITNLVVTLLARNLDLYGEHLSVKDLNRWFGLVEFDLPSSQLVTVNTSGQSYGRYHEKASRSIHIWLNKRAHIQHALIEYELMNSRSGGIESALKYTGVSASQTFRHWCLSRAIQLCNSNPTVAENLFLYSIVKQHGWGDPISDREVALAINGNPRLMEWNEIRLSAQHHIDPEKSEQQREIFAGYNFKKHKHHELDLIRQQQNDLSTGNCSTTLLHHIASIYFDGFITSRGDPKTYLTSYLDGDQKLAQSAIEGFHTLLYRDDLPDLHQICQLYEDGQLSNYTFPFLAAMEEEQDQILHQLKGKLLQRALGFYLTADIQGFPEGSTGTFIHRDFNYLPKWYIYAMKEDPKTVADVFVAIYKASIRAKNLPNEHLIKMAIDHEYIQIASQAVHRLIPVFPTRCSRRQLESLRYILWGAILHGSISVSEIKKLVFNRLQRKNLDKVQRAYWLCVGLVVDRNHSLKLLEEFLSIGRDSRAYDILDFLVLNPTQSLILHNLNQWSIDEVSRLIKAMGRHVHRSRFEDDVLLKSQHRLVLRRYSLVLEVCVQSLTQYGIDQVSHMLTSLASDPELIAWKKEIQRIYRTQLKSHVVIPAQDISLQQVQKILQNKSSVNKENLIIE